MKKLLMLIQGLLISPVAFTPGLIANVEKIDSVAKAERAVSSLDILDFSLTSVNQWITMPNLLKLLQSNPSQGEILDHIIFSLTNKDGDKIEIVHGFNSSEAWSWSIILDDLHGGWIDITKVEFKVISDLNRNNQLSGSWKNKIPPIYQFSALLGNWKWEDQETMDKFLTKDIRLEYTFYFTSRP